MSAAGVTRLWHALECAEVPRFASPAALAAHYNASPPHKSGDVAVSFVRYCSNDCDTITYRTSAVRMTRQIVRVLSALNPVLRDGFDAGDAVHFNDAYVDDGTHDAVEAASGKSAAASEALADFIESLSEAVLYADWREVCSAYRLNGAAVELHRHAFALAPDFGVCFHGERL